MRRHAMATMAFLVLGALAMPAAATDAGAESSRAAGEQGAAAAAAVAHDHGETCGGGGSCCSACQIRQKYAKEKAAVGEAEGGCPCQRAKRAREQAQAQAAERE